MHWLNFCCGDIWVELNYIDKPTENKLTQEENKDTHKRTKHKLRHKVLENISLRQVQRSIETMCAFIQGETKNIWGVLTFIKANSWFTKSAADTFATVVSLLNATKPIIAERASLQLIQSSTKPKQRGFLWLP